jgi:hypothetical protein
MIAEAINTERQLTQILSYTGSVHIEERQNDADEPIVWVCNLPREYEQSAGVWGSGADVGAAINDAWCRWNALGAR